MYDSFTQLVDSVMIDRVTLKFYSAYAPHSLEEMRRIRDKLSEYLERFDSDELAYQAEIEIYREKERKRHEEESQKDWGEFHKKMQNQKKPGERKTGFVYLARNERNGMTKIGFSNNPRQREKTLQSEEPEIHIFHKWRGCWVDEQATHVKFSDSRVRGEWFNLSKSQVARLMREFPE